MDKQIILQKHGEYLIRFLASTLKGNVPSDLPQELSWGKFYALAKQHCVTGMLSAGAQGMVTPPEPNVLAQFQKDAQRQMQMGLLQLFERDVLCEALTSAGVSILPLKGCLMKEMYPAVEYRYMGDLDILFDVTKDAQVQAILEENGYMAEHVGIQHDDSYSKPPYMHVEMHRSMVPADSEYFPYYENIFDRAHPLPENPHHYTLSWDDFYIFMLVHLYKHHTEGGSGIRSIMDIYVFLEAHENDLHRDYLAQEFDKLGITDFVTSMEALAKDWFADEQFSEEFAGLTLYILSSGVFGTKDHYIENRLKKYESGARSPLAAKLSYFYHRVFPGMQVLYLNYPVLKKWKILTPFCWAHRLIYAVVCKRDIVAKEFDGMKEMK
ncbi:MAG: hypothetical protein E7269_00295 [Lachnospiraceae bacterium]|nr:hypothetical protein [Lachnospiraceae bacterium]